MIKTALLLRQKLLCIKNSLKGDILLKRLPFIALGIVFWLLLYIGTFKLLSYIRGIELLGELLSKRLISLLLFSLTGFLILSNIIASISTFYLSRDIVFLAQLPISKKDILLFKTSETVMNSSWMVGGFIPPVFIAYGCAYNSGFSYYLGTFFCLFFFILLLSGIGITLTHCLIRLFPLRGMRDILLFISLVIFILLYLVLRSSMRDISEPSQLLNIFMSLRLDSPLLPHYWLSETIWALLRESKPDTIYLMVLLSNCAFFMMLSLLIGEMFYRGLEPVKKVGYKERKQRLYPSKAMAILYKDIKLFIRDKSQWSQLLIIGALFFVYIYNFKAIPLKDGIIPFIKELIIVINILMSGLVLSAIAARFLYSSISLEGEAFWLIRTAPINIKSFLISKLIYGFVPVFSIVMLMVFLTNLLMKVEGILMFASMSVVAVLCISISGLGVGLGAIYPRFKYENIAGVSMSLPAMFFMLIAVFLVFLTVGIPTVFFYLYYKGDMGPEASGLVVLISVILIVSINFIAFYFPMKMGIKRLRRLD